MGVWPCLSSCHSYSLQSPIYKGSGPVRLNKHVNLKRLLPLSVSSNQQQELRGPALKMAQPSISSQKRESFPVPEIASWDAIWYVVCCPLAGTLQQGCLCLGTPFTVKAAGETGDLQKRSVGDPEGEGRLEDSRDFISVL